MGFGSCGSLTGILASGSSLTGMKSKLRQGTEDCNCHVAGDPPHSPRGLKTKSSSVVASSRCSGRTWRARHCRCSSSMERTVMARPRRSRCLATPKATGRGIWSTSFERRECFYQAAGHRAWASAWARCLAVGRGSAGPKSFFYLSGPSGVLGMRCISLAIEHHRIAIAAVGKGPVIGGLSWGLR